MHDEAPLNLCELSAQLGLGPASCTTWQSSPVVTYRKAVAAAPRARESLSESSWRPMCARKSLTPYVSAIQVGSEFEPLVPLNAETCVRGFAARLLAAAE